MISPNVLTQQRTRPDKSDTFSSRQINDVEFRNQVIKRPKQKTKSYDNSTSPKCSSPRCCRSTLGNRPRWPAFRLNGCTAPHASSSCTEGTCDFSLATRERKRNSGYGHICICKTKKAKKISSLRRESLAKATHDTGWDFTDIQISHTWCAFITVPPGMSGGRSSVK